MGQNSLRFLAWAGMLLFILSITAHAQPGVEAYDRGDLDAVREYLAKGKAASDEAEFLQAALTVDADSAFSLYQSFSASRLQSPLWPRAMGRMRQYYYAKGLYTKADEINNLIATRQAPPVKLTLAESPESKPDTVPPEKSRPQEEKIASAGPTETSSPEPVPMPGQRSGDFVLQLGAFANPDNVQRLRTSLEKAGYTIEVGPVTIRGKRLQAVRAVGFKDKNAALAVVPDLRKKYGLNPILMPPAPDQ